MQAARHVEGRVVVVQARDLDERRREIGADEPEDVFELRAAERADDAPALDADVPDVLASPKQRHDV
jgi:hypothetical protein